MTPLEIAAVIVSALGVCLTIRRKLAAWPILILACVLYGELFRESHLYSDMLLQAVFAVCAMYGWWHWYRGVQDEGSVKVLALSLRGWIAGLAAATAGSLLLGYCMARYTDASLPWLDSALAGFSLVGQWWQARKYLANWWIWIAVDVIYVGEYIYKDLRLTSALYGFFVLLAVLGLRDWQKAMERPTLATLSGTGAE